MREPSSKRKVRNAHIIIDNEGKVVAVYRKIHLFDISGPGLPTLRESSFTEAGDEMVACDTAAGRIGLTVCYDLRFPPLYQALAAAGADILAVPSAFTVPTGAAHWETLLRARAIENQCYVVAAAQTGKHNERPGRASWGHAMVVDPWGTVVAQAGDGHAPGIITAEINHEFLRSVRAKMPVREHARPDLYRRQVTVVGRGPETCSTSDREVVAGLQVMIVRKAS